MSYDLVERLHEFQQVVENTKTTDANNELVLEDGLEQSYNLITRIKEIKGNLYIVGNGGSASVASHAAIDFMNVAKMSAHTLHDSATLTCMANDYGYENAFSNILKTTINKSDLLIAISSSGQSKNIINAVNISKQHGARVITLSGFNSKNSLRAEGCINFWCNSDNYGMVEIAHQFILHNLADRFSERTNN